MEEEGESYSYLNDLSGSVMRLSGNGRDSAASYRYDEFGKDLSGNQGQFQPFGYTGYQRDAVAGTYYAQAREYDAGSGRFTSEDVVKGNAVYPETLNAYGYCWGNPLVFVDRDGREPKFLPGDDYETIGTDENGVPVIKKKEQYFVPADDYDENGMPILPSINQSIEAGDVDLLDSTYDTMTDGLGVMNETGNYIIPKYIQNQPRPKNIGKGIWNKGITRELAEQSKFYSKASKVLEKLGYIGIGVDVFIGIYKNIEAGTSWQRTLSDAVVDLTISLFIFAVAPFLAEITAGVIGGVIGAVIGFLFGSVVGSAAGAIIGSTLAMVIFTIVYAYFLDKLLNDCKMDNGKTFKENLKDTTWEAINRIDNFVEDMCECID